MKNDSKKIKKVGLALGGGAAKALAHIGVIKTLNAAGIKIDFIAGTSMGALVGGWYAAKGDVSFLETQFQGLTHKDIYSPGRLLRNHGGNFFRNRVIAERIEEELKGIKIEDCNIPFRAVATDIANGDEVVLLEGSLTDAIRASTALPVVFRPVKIGERTLIDGGFSNPVPADVVRHMGAECVIGVDVTSRWIDFTDVSLDFHLLYSMMSNALSVVEYQLAKKILAESADIVLKPAVLSYGWLEFDRAAEIIERGREGVRDRLSEIREKSGYPEPERTAAGKFWDFLFGEI